MRIRIHNSTVYIVLFSAKKAGNETAKILNERYKYTIKKRKRSVSMEGHPPPALVSDAAERSTAAGLNKIPFLTEITRG